jgi:TolB-like protein/DNA-binding winged helix-turn-helix (wHTH) protein
LDIATNDKGVFGFGPFLLDPVRRRLTLDGEVVKLPPTQFDTLLYLVQNPGRVVEKDELLAAVWGGRIIEEGNLSQAIYLLRRALGRGERGDGYIVTAPGRGYRFSAAVQRIFEAAAAEETGTPLEPAFGAKVSNPAPAPAIVSAGGRRPRFLLHAALVAALIIAVLGATVLRQSEPLKPEPGSVRSETAFNPPAHSVGVLAFTNMSGDPQQEYFSDGLSEELINALSRTDAIRVAARMSAFTFKGSTATIGEIARKLNVGAVLEGSVRRQGTHLRVTAQLINAVSGYQFWSHSYDRDTSDTLALEAEIANAVARSLEVTLLADQKAKLETGGSKNPDAIDAYLRGSAEMRFFAEKNARAAEKDFAEALSIDPDYADARAGHAYALTAIAIAWCPDDQMRSLLARARADATKAVSLAPASAKAHAVLGTVLKWQADLKGADAELSLAYALGPDDILVSKSYAGFEGATGHPEEAQAAALHMVALDPLTSEVYRRLALVLLYGHKYQEALIALHRERALGAMDPDRSKRTLTQVHASLGDWQAVQRDCEGFTTDDHCLSLLVIADWKLGQTALAHTAFDTLLSKSKADPSYITNAEVYAQWGNREMASRSLLAASEQTGNGALDELKLDIRVDALLDPVRDTPGFKILEQRMSFPP